jgi:hypothetical protein
MERATRLELATLSLGSCFGVSLQNICGTIRLKKLISCETTAGNLWAVLGLRNLLKHALL